MTQSTGEMTGTSVKTNCVQKSEENNSLAFVLKANWQISKYMGEHNIGNTEGP